MCGRINHGAQKQKRRFTEFHPQRQHLVRVEELNPSEIRAAVKAALAEDDQHSGDDVTTLATVPKTQTCKAVVQTREPLVITGFEIAEATFRRLS